MKNIKIIIETVITLIIIGHIFVKLIFFVSIIFLAS